MRGAGPAAAFALAYRKGLESAFVVRADGYQGFASSLDPDGLAAHLRATLG